jgi:hypothetical protein
MTILTLEQDAWLALTAGLGRSYAAAMVGRFVVDRQNHDRTRMPDDIAPRTHASGLFHFIRGYAEYRASVADARRQNASLGRSYRR